MKTNVIYNRDCLAGMAKLPDGSVDLIVTDPPYLVSYKTSRRLDKNHRFGKVILGDNDSNLIVDYIAQCHRVLKDNSAMYMFCSMDKVDFFKQELEKLFKIKNMIIWVKNNHTAGDLKAQFGKKYEIVFLVNKGRKPFNGLRINDVWEFNKVTGGNQLHQNQKPLDLIEQCIVKHSDKGEVVLDGFMGSGTTAIACMNTGRKFIGYELDEGYFEVAQERLRKYKKDNRKVRYVNGK